MIVFAQAVAYYPGDRDGTPGAPMVAFIERVIDDDTADITVLRRRATLYDVPRCDAAQPTAGCWSVLP